MSVPVCEIIFLEVSLIASLPRMKARIGKPIASSPVELLSVVLYRL